jgi:CubicO group peptidase (beta-lactamase class C family)
MSFAQGAAEELPANETISRILAERLGPQQKSVGIVVGVIGPAGRRVVSFGSLDTGDKRTLGGDTVFEIGSATKVFTSLLLADMVQRGEVALTDPVAKYLPAGVHMPERGGKAITLQDLATHTSGLPRLPANLMPRDAANPYADYSVEQLYEFLNHYQLTRDIGSQYEYSNLGGGLLGHVLARRAGMDYETLVRTRICGPLKMDSTRITLSPALKARLAPGHDASLKTVSNWDLPTLAGAGALRSTAEDLLNLLAAALGYTKSSLAPAFASMLQTRRPTNIPDTEVALGWHVTKRDGVEIVWHNGGTGGYRSYMAYDPSHRTGVVAFTNMFTAAGVDDLALHLLHSQFPLATPPKSHQEVTVDPKLYDDYAGNYQLAPGFVLSITREGKSLMAQATGQPKVEIFPEGQREFFYKVVDAQISFETDEKGHAQALVLHQNGRDMRAPRLAGEAPQPKEHKQVAIDPKLYEGLPRPI